MTSSEGPMAGHVDAALLADLALGVGDELDPAARAHLEQCSTCAGEVAALSETLALVSAAGDEELVAPPPSVWAAISAEIEAERAPTQAPAEQAPATVTPLESRRESRQESRRDRVPTWLAAVAASVALAAGVGLGSVVAGGDDEDDAPPAAQVVGRTSLASLDQDPQDRGAAEVRRRDDRLVLRVEASDLGGPDGTREVWLINTDGTRMVSLGLLAGGEAGEFEFPERLLDQGYRIVDISYEPDDGDPVHSGKSLARGTIDG